MSNRRISTKDTAIMGVLMALQIIVTRFLAIETQVIRISFTFIPIVIMAMMFSPMLTGVGTMLADFIGIMLFPKGAPFFPGFSLSAFLTGVIYAIFFYKKKMTWTRVIAANIIISVLIDIVLNTLWLYMMLGQAAIVALPARIVKAMVTCVVRVFLTYTLGNQGVLKQQLVRFQN